MEISRNIKYSLQKRITERNTKIQTLLTGIPQEDFCLKKKSKKNKSIQLLDRIFLNEILNSLDTLVIVLNKKGQIIFFNSLCEKTLGYSLGELRNKPFWNIFLSGEEKSSTKEVFRKVDVDHFPKSYQNTCTAKNGAKCLVSWMDKVILNPFGEIDYIVKTGTKVIEPIPDAKIIPLHTNSIIDSTSQKIAEEKLREQAEELFKINQELDRFVYSTSHDLRAPLTSVLGLINIIKEEFKNNDLLNYLNLAEKSVLKLDKIIRNILEYSKNNRIEVIREEIDFKSLLKDIFSNYTFWDNGKLKKKIRIKQTSPFYSDPRRFTVILDNIISNAIRFADKDKSSFISISITVNKSNAKIHVRDNGIGIPEEQLPKIFDMFVRATERSDGAGLGLYIVKEAVKKLNGIIKVNSELNIGTSFTIVIPNT